MWATPTPTCSTRGCDCREQATPLAPATPTATVGCPPTALPLRATAGDGGACAAGRLGAPGVRGARRRLPCVRRVPAVRQALAPHRGAHSVRRLGVAAAVPVAQRPAIRPGPDPVTHALPPAHPAASASLRPASWWCCAAAQAAAARACTRPITSPGCAWAGDPPGLQAWHVMQAVVCLLCCRCGDGCWRSGGQCCQRLGAADRAVGPAQATTAKRLSGTPIAHAPCLQPTPSLPAPNRAAARAPTCACPLRRRPFLTPGGGGWGWGGGTPCGLQRVQAVGGCHTPPSIRAHAAAPVPLPRPAVRVCMLAAKHLPCFRSPRLWVQVRLLDALQHTMVQAPSLSAQALARAEAGAVQLVAPSRCDSGSNGEFGCAAGGSFDDDGAAHPAMLRRSRRLRGARWLYRRLDAEGRWLQDVLCECAGRQFGGCWLWWRNACSAPACLRVAHRLLQRAPMPEHARAQGCEPCTLRALRVRTPCPPTSLRRQAQAATTVCGACAARGRDNAR